jgi:hypothetical protein
MIANVQGITRISHTCHFSIARKLNLVEISSNNHGRIVKFFGVFHACSNVGIVPIKNATAVKSSTTPGLSIANKRIKLRMSIAIQILSRIVTLFTPFVKAKIEITKLPIVYAINTMSVNVAPPLSPENIATTSSKHHVTHVTFLGTYFPFLTLL